MSTMRNSVMLIGYPTQPKMDSGNRTASFNLSVKGEGKDKQKTYTFFCVGFDTVAQRIVANIKEGLQTAIDGSLRQFEYKDHNGYHIQTEIVVHDMFIIDKRKD